MRWCQYKDLFGRVGEGVHSYRLFDVAVVDVLCTVLAAALLHVSFPQYRFEICLAWLFLMGVVLHRLCCVRTTVDRMLF